MPGLQLANGHQHPTVYKPPEPLPEECTQEQIFVSEAHAQVLKTAIFAVFPIRFTSPDHWAVLILDKSEKVAFFFDSLQASRAKRSRRGFQLVNGWYVLEHAEQRDLTVDFYIHKMSVPQQSLAICGLIVLESVRVFSTVVTAIKHFIDSPAIISHCNMPIGWKIALCVPVGKVVLGCKQNKRWDCLTLFSQCLGSAYYIDRLVAHLAATQLTNHLMIMMTPLILLFLF